ncbi:MAG: hypothetical protein BGN85_04535 [Alphaproteobacteria bacterium 64-11]|nr:hypothetical protein [Alphaproteobacteria bacterium]OJU12532.1 MAG: hypothetical protein BGN85_04535 [Alphaproteobacteria bacterium 64-11]
MHEKIQEGFDVFLHDGDDSVGAVRRVHRHGIMVYVEDAGDYDVPVAAIVDVDAEKVILDAGKLDPKMLDAIRRRHRDEDPKLVG